MWAEGAGEPSVTAFEALDDARAELKRAIGEGRSRVELVNPDGIVIESAEA